MKGIIFTEFLEMVEDQFSADMVDDIILMSDLPSNGAYTSLGTYDYQEMVQLVVGLSQQTGIAVSDLIQSFGSYLFARFVVIYPQFIAPHATTISLLQNIEGYIHQEVLKLYPQAQLPHFDCEMPRPGCLIMTYQSIRPFADLAHGLIRGCINHFNEPITLLKEDLSDGAGTAARFTITLTD